MDIDMMVGAIVDTGTVDGDAIIGIVDGAMAIAITGIATMGAVGNHEPNRRTV